MSTPYAHVGPLAASDIQAIWVSAVDSSYAEPLIAAGEGEGFEAYTQAFQQWARVSQAIDVSLQSMFILPWSGQTNPPASGPAVATVVLQFTRTQFLQKPLVLAQGQILVDEQQTDWGPNPGDSGQTVLTGRTYVLTGTVCIQPGEQGPFSVEAQAVAPGPGYNNPLPGTLSSIEQPGTGFTNDGSSISLVGPFPPANPANPGALVFLQTTNEPDTFINQHIGQYVQMVAGPNTGQIGRILSYTPPNPTLGIGAIVGIAIEESVESFTLAVGTFQPGEIVIIKNGGTIEGHGTIINTATGDLNHTRITFDLVDGSFQVGWTLLGDLSGATANIDHILSTTSFVTETGTGTWRILDWVLDWGLTVTNLSSPTGGKAGMLDALGYDRGLPRNVNETDNQYRNRIAQIADVVTPNAVRRMLNRTMGTDPWCFREVGSLSFPGMYYDRTDDFDFYDGDSWNFHGGPPVGTFFQGFEAERVSWQDSSGNEKARGWIQFVNASKAYVTRTGLNPIVPSNFAAGDKLVGLHSGAHFPLTSISDSTTTVEASRFHLDLDYTEFRAFFIIGVPQEDVGDFGIAYDSGVCNAYDAAPFNNFFDGYPVTTANYYLQIWQAINNIRAGGVGFDLYLETGSCP
jgi:hypothetical protein